MGKKRQSEVVDVDGPPANGKRARHGLSSQKNTRSRKDGDAESTLPIRSHDSSTLTAPAKSHIRFGSAEPSPAPIPAPAAEVPKEDDLSSDDSDDDAPEEISHLHAAAELRATQAQQTHALRRKADEAKDQRRLRDAQQKAQVRHSQKRQLQLDEDEESGDENHIPLSGAESKKFDTERLPTLLPEELLATEAPVRPPTPPPLEDRGRSRKQLKPGKKRRPAEPTSKDVIVKDTKVRVLQSQNALLPPKASGKIRTVKANYLRVRGPMEKQKGKGRVVSKLKRRVGPQAFV